MTKSLPDDRDVPPPDQPSYREFSLTMNKLPITKATAPLNEYVEKLTNNPLVVTFRGKPVAVLVGVSEADLEALSISKDPGEYLLLVERSRRRLQEEANPHNTEKTNNE